jgi:hypothetical protein
MMKRVVIVITALAAMVLLPVRPAAAAGIDLWELLSELHGPGPFHGYSASVEFVCHTRESDVRAFAGRDVAPPAPGQDRVYTTWIAPYRDAATLLKFGELPTTAEMTKAIAAAREGNVEDLAHLLCLADRRVKGYATANVKYFRSYQNNVFPSDLTKDDYQVRFLDLSLSYFARVHPAVDIGMRAGVARFSGDVFDPFYRLSLDLAEAQFYPLALLGDELKFRAIAVGAAAHLHAPGFDRDDFCTEDGSGRCQLAREYVAAPHVQWRLSLQVRPAALIELFKKPR